MESNLDDFSNPKFQSEKEVDYVISLIKDEILSLYKIRTNLKKYAFVRANKENIPFLKFNMILDEVSNIMVEISLLEQTKKEYIKIKESFTSFSIVAVVD